MSTMLLKVFIKLKNVLGLMFGLSNVIQLIWINFLVTASSKKLFTSKLNTKILQT